MVGYRATIKTVLGDLRPAHVGRPQRAQVGAINTRQKEHLIVDLLEGFHVFGAEDVAILNRHRDTNRVAEVGQIVLVLEHVDDIGVFQRNHLAETGIRANLQRLIAKKHGNNREQRRGTSRFSWLVVIIS